jgi:hypothetical protein
MRNLKLFENLLAIIVLSSPITISAVAAASAGHDHDHAATPATLTLDAGKKWMTDTPLRQAMTNIRNAVSDAVPAIHADKYSASEYETLAKKIDSEIGYIVRNCQLKPAADAQLHLVLARILEGIAAMEGKTEDVTRQSGAVSVMRALKDYNIYFDHPGWIPVKH